MYIPLVLVARESVWTQEQADIILGQLVLAIKVKWAFFGVMLGLGLLCIGLTVKCISNRRKFKSDALKSRTSVYDLVDHDEIKF